MNIHSEHPPSTPCDHDCCPPTHCELKRLQAENARLTDQNAALQVEIAKAVEVPVQERLDAAEAEVERCHREMKRLQAENARLAAVLDTAPHSMDCNVETDPPFPVYCNCFKSKWPIAALRDLLAPTIELLREAADSVHAYIAERDISDTRRRYRVDLKKELREELARLEALVKGDKP